MKQKQPKAEDVYVQETVDEGVRSYEQLVDGISTTYLTYLKALNTHIPNNEEGGILVKSAKLIFTIKSESAIQNLGVQAGLIESTSAFDPIGGVRGESNLNESIRDLSNSFTIPLNFKKKGKINYLKSTAVDYTTQFTINITKELKKFLSNEAFATNKLGLWINFIHSPTIDWECVYDVDLDLVYVKTDSSNFTSI